jgi:hypothetical protein
MASCLSCKRVYRSRGGTRDERESARDDSNASCSIRSVLIVVGGSIRLHHHQTFGIRYSSRLFFYAPFYSPHPLHPLAALLSDSSLRFNKASRPQRRRLQPVNLSKDHPQLSQLSCPSPFPSATGPSDSMCWAEVHPIRKRVLRDNESRKGVRAFIDHHPSCRYNVQPFLFSLSNSLKGSASSAHASFLSAASVEGRTEGEACKKYLMLHSLRLRDGFPYCSKARARR